MGRSGRSGGGRSGGSRMSGGRSASGSFSSGRSVSSSPSGSHRNRRYIYPSAPLGGGVSRGGMFGGGNVIINVDNQQETHSQPINNNTPMAPSSKEKSGAFDAVVSIAIWMLLVYILLFFAGGSSGQGDSDVTKSTVSRAKLHLGLSDEAGYFTDECDWIRNRTVLEQGLKAFYDSTGILPYVYIIDNVAGDYDPSTEKLEQFAETQYEKLFDDEGHILLVFWDYAGAYEYLLWLGADAAELMDAEACDILFDYLDYYYYYADTEEEFFADAFADAGERMMRVTRSPMYYIVMTVIGGAVILVTYRGWKSRKEKETARKKRAEEILNAPLEKFGTNGDVIDELEKKYEKEI